MIKLTVTTTQVFNDQETFAEFVSIYRKSNKHVPPEYFRRLIQKGEAQYLTRDNGPVGAILTRAEVTELQS